MRRALFSHPIARHANTRDIGRPAMSVHARVSKHTKTSITLEEVRGFDSRGGAHIGVARRSVIHNERSNRA